METRLQKLVKNLKSASGIEIHRYIVEAFEYMGFKANEISSTQSEPDIIVFSRNARNPYMLVIEANVVIAKKLVGTEKVSQIRGSAPSHISQAVSEGKIASDKGYMIVVGKPNFSDDAIRKSEPDVCLISVDDLIDLIISYECYMFSHEDLEDIFSNPGRSAEYFKRVVIKHSKDTLLTYGLVCYVMEKLFKGNSALPYLNEAISSVKFVLDLYKLPKSEKRIQNAINLLSDPLVGLFILQDERFWMNSRVPRDYLPIRFGILGEKLYQAYDYWKHHFRNTHFTEDFD